MKWPRSTMTRTETRRISQNRVLKDLKKLETSPSDRGQPLGSRNTGNLTGLRKIYVGPRKGCRAVFTTEGDAIAIVMVVAARSESECYELAVSVSVPRLPVWPQDSAPVT